MLPRREAAAYVARPSLRARCPLRLSGPLFYRPPLNRLILLLLAVLVPTLASIDASAQAPGRVAGQVVDTEGTPVAGAWVGLFDEEGDFIGDGAVTDENGQYTIWALAGPGTYHLRASYANLSRSLYNVTVSSGDMSRADVEVTTCTGFAPVLIWEPRGLSRSIYDSRVVRSPEDQR